MAHLEVRLLGSFAATFDGQPISGLSTAKTRGLLAYLMVEMDQPHVRETLAAMFWPDSALPSALANLRSVLCNIHHALAAPANEPPFLLINREAIRFNPASHYWLDTRALEQHVVLGLNSSSATRPSPYAIEHLQAALSLCRGRFLEGVRVKSGSFEEWVLLQRERVHRLTIDTLDHLALAFAARHEFTTAVEYSRRQLEIEPWREEAHQQVMRLLALGGERSGAMAQYETCRRALMRDLGVQPALETRQLFQQIRDGTLARPQPVVFAELSSADPVSNLGGSPPHQPSSFIGRTHELAWLQSVFNAACAGQGSVVFVTGDIGSGKTALMQAFACQVIQRDQHVLVAAGNCEVQTGASYPCLPFREILEELVGKVTVDAACGILTPEHVRRLLAASIPTMHLLLETGPHLVGTMIPAELLRAHLPELSLAVGEPVLPTHQVLPEHSDGTVDTSPRHQADLFEQVTRVLQTMAVRYPLVLMLDSLQWADKATTDLLFRLGQRLRGSRMMVIGAFRPLAPQVSTRAPRDRHPLEWVVNELRRDANGIILDLDQLEGRDFVDAWLGTEPNHLDSRFRDILFRYTNGNPLLTVELIRAMQVSGDLIRDAHGSWAEGPGLSWNRLPAPIEAVIVERLAPLSPELRDVLTIASIEGTEFTAEVIAQVLGRPTAEVVHHLSDGLSRQHQLVIPEGIWAVNGQHVARYRFRHALIQEYLYHSLDAIERAYLHEAIERAIHLLDAPMSGQSCADGTRD